MKAQETSPRMDIKECLKLIESGDIHMIDVERMSKEFLSKPLCGDHLQFELHKYCRNKKIQETDVPVIAQLANLCYSHPSVSEFVNMERFVGCAYYISTYFLNSGHYGSALEISSSLEIKKKEIIESSRNSSDTRNFLFNLHNSFMQSAMFESSKPSLSYKLALESLRFFQLTDTQNVNIGKKVLKRTKAYLLTLKEFNEEQLLVFWKLLSGSLQTLLPGFTKTDHVLFIIYKMDSLKAFDYAQGESIHVFLRTIINLVAIMLDFPEKTKQNLNCLLEFFFVDGGNVPCLDKSRFNDIYSYENPNSLVCFLLVSYIFHHGSQFWWKIYDANWSSKISAVLVNDLCKEIMNGHDIHFSNISSYCTSPNLLFDICFDDVLTGNLLKIMYTVRLCLKNIPNCLFLASTTRHAFKHAMNFICNKNKSCVVTLKNYVWKHSVVHYTNTIEDILRQAMADDSWLYLKDCSPELLKEIVNSEFELPCDFRRINILFQRWLSALWKLQKFSEALFACVVYYVSYPQDESEIISMWLQTKSESSNEIIQETTMNDVLKVRNASIKEFNKKYESSQIEVKSLLLLELKAYCSCPPNTFRNPKTPHDLVLRIWKQLDKLKLDLWDQSLALSCLISTNLSGDDDKLLRIFKKKYETVFQSLMNWEINGNPRCRSLLHAANLKFSLFLYNVKQAENTEDKMNSTELVLGYLKKVEEEKVKFGEDVDLNLTCNVMPSSSHLTVDVETNYFEALNVVVGLWKEVFKDGLEDVPAKELGNWLLNLKEVAYIYELIGEYGRSFSTWLMFYKIANLQNDPLSILTGISHIIENCSNVEGSELLNKGEDICRKLGSEVKEKSTFVEYCLSVASNYLKNRNYEQCLEYLHKIKSMLEGLRNCVNSYVLNARFWCLVSQFLCVQPEFENQLGYPRRTDVRLIAFKAFNYANAAARDEYLNSATQADCTKIILVRLEVSLWTFHLHGVYSQTDFMRFLLDDLYQIVQRLFLPTRTAEMLVRLAEVDLICEKLMDCQEKVTKLKSILTTLASRCGEIKKVEKSESPYVIKSSLEKLSPRPISPARFLDKPHDSRERDPSPVHFDLVDVNSTKSRRHLKQCECRLCHNILVQILTINTLNLEADMYAAEGCYGKAAECYRQAHDTLSKLYVLQAKQSRLLQFETTFLMDADPGDLDFYQRILKFYSARFLIRYAKFEMGALNMVTENVKTIICTVSDILKALSYEEKLLNWTFVELKLLTVIVNKSPGSLRQINSTPVVYKAISDAKTPFAQSLTKPICIKEQNNFLTKSKEKNDGDDGGDKVIENNKNLDDFMATKNDRKQGLTTITGRKLTFDDISSPEESEITRTVRKKRIQNTKKLNSFTAKDNAKKILKSTIKIHADLGAQEKEESAKNQKEKMTEEPKRILRSLRQKGSERGTEGRAECVSVKSTRLVMKKEKPELKKYGGNGQEAEGSVQNMSVDLFKSYEELQGD